MARTKKDGVQSPIETPLKPHHILFDAPPFNLPVLFMPQRLAHA
jgi:hypothetical protein